MRLKNIEVEPFIEFLMSFELKGKESRLRTRFVKLLMERLQTVNEDHMDLIKQYANLDENGVPKQIEKDGLRMYDMKDKDSFNKEYYILMSEDCIIEENEERKDALLFVKDLILNCDKVFSGKEALEYDRWCDIVEEVEYKDK